MKRMILFGLILCLIPSLITAVTVDIGIETAYTEPYPIEPGKNLVLGIDVSNSGNDEAEDVIVTLEPDAPFTLLESSRKGIKTLHVGSSIVVEYDLFVDSSAVSAVYEIPVRVLFDRTNMTRKLQVRVQGTPKFKVLDMDSKMKIEPGNQGSISSVIKNVGSGKAKRITIEFSPSSTYIQPVFSKGIVYIGEMNPNEEREVDFEIVVDPDAEYGVYTGMVNISYEDESGDEFSEDFDVGILVKGKPELQVIKIEADKTDNELKVELINTGSAKAVGIKGELFINDNVFDIDYITQIKIDKHATMKFNLPSSSNAGLKLTYKGPDNEGYSQTETVVWKVPFTLPSWVVGIVLIVGVYFVWKKKLWKKVF